MPDPSSGHQGSLFLLKPCGKDAHPTHDCSTLGCRGNTGFLWHTRPSGGAGLPPRELFSGTALQRRSFSTYCLSRHPKIQGADSSPASASAKGDGSTSGTSTARGRWTERCCPAGAGGFAAVSSRTTPQDFSQKHSPVLLSHLILSDKPLRKSRAHRSQFRFLTLLIISALRI